MIGALCLSGNNWISLLGNGHRSLSSCELQFRGIEWAERRFHAIGVIHQSRSRLCNFLGDSRGSELRCLLDILWWGDGCGCHGRRQVVNKLLSGRVVEEVG